ncbi:hypothetical protein DCM91_12685 [Chitinophaga costaii]|nr:hypothetical protein DCM91_12685 [Chitinophaga costaii]
MHAPGIYTRRVSFINSLFCSSDNLAVKMGNLAGGLVGIKRTNCKFDQNARLMIVKGGLA